MSHAWMPFYVDDYLADTGHLSATEHGAYMLLIMHYWKNGGLPGDERLISRVAKLSSDQWAESRDIISMLFEDGWRHKRIDDELAKATEIIGKRKAAATAMHNKRNASAEQVQSKCSDTHVPPSPTPTVKEEPNGSSKKRATRLPADWVIPESWLQEAIAAGMTREHAASEANRMRNWSMSNKNGAKLDWLATWRNWFDDKIPKAASPPQQQREPRNAGERALMKLQNGHHHEPPSPPDRYLDPGDGRRQIEGTGLARRFAGAPVTGP